MAVKLRLVRMGAKKRPAYRIVASDSRARRDGEYIELVGRYNPILNETVVNEEVALKWLKNGAQPTETARNILVKEGILQAKEKNAPKTDKKKKESK